MFSYFQVHWAAETDKNFESYGVAYADDRVDIDLIPANGTRIDNWDIIEFELRDGVYSDYQPNDLGVRLCSEKLKQVIDDNLLSQDNVQWLETIVRSDNSVEKKYHILHFPKNYPDIDYKKSVIMDNDIIKPIFLRSAFNHKHICSIPNEYGVEWYISKELKDKIVQAECTCISFTKVTVHD